MFKCPSCDRNILNRRLSNCEFCSELLPKELQYSDEELTSLHDKSLELKDKQRERENNQWNTRWGDSLGSTSFDFND